MSLNLRSNLLRSNYYCCCFEVVVGLAVQRLPVRNIRDTIENNLLSNRNFVSLAKGSLISESFALWLNSPKKVPKNILCTFPLDGSVQEKDFTPFWGRIKVRVKNFLSLSYLYIKRLISYHNCVSPKSKSQHLTYKLIEIPGQSSWSKCMIKKGENLSLELTFICFNCSLHKANWCVLNFKWKKKKKIDYYILAVGDP